MEMIPDWQYWMIYLFPLGVFLFVLAVVTAFKVKKNRLIKEVGMRLGFNPSKGFFFSSPGIYGDHCGRKLFIGETAEGFGKNRRYFFTIELNAKKPLPVFSLAEENIFHKIGKKLGLTEANLGNPEFDNHFFISGHEDDLKAALDIDTQRRIMEFGSGFKIATDVDRLTFKTTHWPDEDKAIYMVEKLLQVIEGIEKDHGN